MELYVDHFFKVLPDHMFDKACEDLKDVVVFSHSKNSSGTETWEGIYIYAANGSYLEILRETPAWPCSTTGFCFSQHGHESDIHGYMTGTFPALPWVNQLQTFTNGEPWFYYSDLKPKERFHFWTADYQGNGAERRQRFKDDLAEIMVFSKVTALVPAAAIDQIRNQFSWASPLIKTDLGYSLSFKNSETPPLKVTIGEADAETGWEIEAQLTSGTMKRISFLWG